MSPTSLWYFAHPVSDYGTQAERRILDALALNGIAVENPNQPHHQEGYAREGMDYFLERVLPACTGCVFLPFPGGLVGSGVAMEVEHFAERRCQVLEVGLDPGLGVYLLTCRGVPESRVLTREETRGATKLLRSLPNGGR